MGAVNTTYTFTATDTITSTKMNNIIDETVITSDAIIGTTLEVASGKLKVRSAGITSNELASGAVTYSSVQPISSMKALGNVTGATGLISEVSILDEDNMASDSATSLVTQQSIKAYVDTRTAGVITFGTPVASTSGSSINFTGIPATVKRITINFVGVSATGTTPYKVRIGDSGGLETTSYISSASFDAGRAGFTDGFGVQDSTTAGSIYSGSVILTRLSAATNTWIESGILADSIYNYVHSSGGYKTLSDTLDRVSVVTTGTFDLGSINIMYE